MNKINIAKYNECFKSDYHTGVGRHAAQKIEFYESLNVYVIIIVAHWMFTTITKTYSKMNHLIEE